MENQLLHSCKSLLLTFVLSLAGFTAFSQNYLFKPVKLHVSQQKLVTVLEDIGRQGGFHFSYSSGIIRSDSLVSIQHFNGDVKTALNILLGDSYEYQESPNHLIIRPAPFRLTLMPEELGEGKKIYTIKGYVVDEKTGAGIHNASVYEKRLLVGTMTDRKGYFKLKLKTKDGNPMILTVSKELYKDTTTVFLPTVNLGKNINSSGHYGYMGDGEESVSNTALARLFLSSKQKLNALNLGNFFAYTPVQVSLTPGLSSHGMMSGQVVNKFSANLIGGYTAGVHGVELAGIFNIDRYHVKYVQAAGAVNMVGGNMSGVQLSGIYNTVIDSLKGFQAAGVFNFVKKHANGVQLAGIMNYAEELRGVQIAGILNRTKTNHGLQFGLINMADTSSGISIGLVNISKNGMKRLSVSSNEVLYTNLAFKSGNANLYSILSAGYGSWNGEQTFATGFGLGHEFRRRNQDNYFAVELLSQQLHRSVYENVSSWTKMNILYNYSLGQKTKLYVAPTINFLSKNKQVIENAQDIPSAGYPYLLNKERFKWWVGLELGVAFF